MVEGSFLGYFAVINEVVPEDYTRDDEIEINYLAKNGNKLTKVPHDLDSRLIKELKKVQAKSRYFVAYLDDNIYSC